VQIAVLDVFDQKVGHPARTIAWGHSLGGMITAGLVQLFPNRFTAALPMCGVVAGGPGVWNQGLDSEFAFGTLLAPTVKLVNFTSFGDAGANFGAATAALASIPYLDQVLRKLIELGYERALRASTTPSTQRSSHACGSLWKRSTT